MSLRPVDFGVTPIKWYEDVVLGHKFEWRWDDEPESGLETLAQYCKDVRGRAKVEVLLAVRASRSFYAAMMFLYWGSSRAAVPRLRIAKGSQMLSLMRRAEQQFFRDFMKQDAATFRGAASRAVSAFARESRLKIAPEHAGDFFLAAKDLGLILRQLVKTGPRAPEWALGRLPDASASWERDSMPDLAINYAAVADAVFVGPFPLLADYGDEYPEEYGRSLEVLREETFPALIVEQIFKERKRFVGFEVVDGYLGVVDELHPYVASCHPELADMPRFQTRDGHGAAAALWVSKDNRVCWTINPCCAVEFCAAVERVAAIVALKLNYHPGRPKRNKPWLVASGAFAAMNGFEHVERDLTLDHREATMHALMGGICYAISKVQLLVLLGCSRSLVGSNAKGQERFIDGPVTRMIGAFRAQVAVNRDQFSMEWYTFILWCAYGNPSSPETGLSLLV